MPIESMFKSGYTATLEKGIELGRKEGIELGRKEGIEVGRAMGFQHVLLRSLEKRFGETPAWLRLRIQAIEDPARLEELLDPVWDARTLEEIETRIPPATQSAAGRPDPPSGS